MRTITLIGLILISFIGYSQEIHPVKKPKTIEIIKEKPIEDISDETDQLYNSVEQMPEYPGGMREFYNFIAQNYQIPRALLEQGVNGTIQVSFIVETDGSLSNIKVIRDLGYGTAEEAIRVLKKSKKWIPGIQEERPVRVNYMLPIRLVYE